MISPESAEVARRGETLYEEKLRAKLEKSHWGAFIAIEPDSEQYFLGTSLHEVAEAAQHGCPHKRVHMSRVGFPAAVEFGCAQ